MYSPSGLSSRYASYGVGPWGTDDRRDWKRGNRMYGVRMRKIAEGCRSKKGERDEGKRREGKEQGRTFLITKMN
jgi:hypothetical protein